MDERPQVMEIVLAAFLALFVVAVPVLSILFWSWVPLVLGLSALLAVLFGGRAISLTVARRRAGRGVPDREARLQQARQARADVSRESRRIADKMANEARDPRQYTRRDQPTGE